VNVRTAPEISIKPRTGMRLLFQQSIIHEGSVVTAGVKYVARTDRMYRSVSSPGKRRVEPARSIGRPVRVPRDLTNAARRFHRPKYESVRPRPAQPMSTWNSSFSVDVDSVYA
jgi:hypothetical protein